MFVLLLNCGFILFWEEFLFVFGEIKVILENVIIVVWMFF